jgi:hypothetical protein
MVRVDREAESALHELPELMAGHKPKRRSTGSRASKLPDHQNPTRYAQTTRRVKRQEQQVVQRKGERIAERLQADRKLSDLDEQVDKLQRRLLGAGGAKAIAIQRDLDKARRDRDQRKAAGAAPSVAIVNRNIADLSDALAKAESARDAGEVRRLKEELRHTTQMRDGLIDDVIRGNAEGELWELLA